MTSRDRPGGLGDLADLAEIADGLPPGTLTAQVFHAREMVSMPNTQDIRNALPVVVGGEAALPWAIAAVALLSGREVPALVPDRTHGDGRIDHAEWSAVCAAARDAARELRPNADIPERLVDEIHDAGFQIVLGLLRRTAQRGSPVLVDGPVAAAAALVLEEAAPGQTDHVLPVQRGSTRLEEVVWTRLGRTAILPWRTHLIDGELAGLAVEAIRTAGRLSRKSDRPTCDPVPAADQRQQEVS